MTKNNFIALAGALKATKPPRLDGGQPAMQWRDDVIAVMEVCEKMNPRFHKGKFLAACGVPNLMEK